MTHVQEFSVRKIKTLLFALWVLVASPTIAFAQAQANIQIAPGTPNILQLLAGSTPTVLGSFPTGGLFTPYANQLSETQTTNYTVLASDRGYFITFNCSGACTATLNTAAYAAGFTVDVVNIGTGALTIAPNSGLINGGASSTLAAGSGGHIVFSGTNYAGNFGSTGLGTGNVVGTGTSVVNHIPLITNTSTTAIVDSGFSIPSMYSTRDAEFLLTDYSGIGDGKSAADGAVSASSTAFTSASAAFTSGDVGKFIAINGAGASGAVLGTTISAYTSATAVTLATAATTAVTAATYSYGTDNLVPEQNLLAAAGAIAGTAVIPIGTFLSSGPVVISTSVSAVSIVGVSMQRSILGYPASAGISFTTSGGTFTARNMTISCDALNNASPCFTLGTATVGVDESAVENIQFLPTSGIGILSYNVGATHYSHNYFWQCKFYCIELQAPANPDGGDNWINDNFMLNYGALAGTGVGIFHVGGGGWKIDDDKINGFAEDYFLQANMTSGQDISDLQINGGSFEGYASFGVLIQSTNLTSSLLNTTITGLQTGGGTGSVGIEIQDQSAAPNAWISNTAITGYINRGANQAGCLNLNGMFYYSVTGGSCTDATGGGAAGSVGVTIGVANSYGFLSSMPVTNFATNAVVNNGGVTNVVTNVGVP